MISPEQERVVKHHGKPLLVVAGAGTGKTTTLAHKVGFLIRDLGISEEEILCVTFTNKAASEIKERVRQVAGVDLPWAGTFHSVALKILRQERGNFSIADDRDVRAILKEILPKFGIDPSEIDRVRSLIRMVKEDLKETGSETFAEVLNAYQTRLRDIGLMDLSDLMYDLYRTLSSDTAVRERWRGRFRFILVDEFQDTNTVQYEILRLISGRDLCAVGDPNQCVYEWRFARPQNILRFLKDFKPDVIKIGTNYRSGPYIVAVANSILEGSRSEWRTLIPRLRSVRDVAEKPLVRRFDKEEEEAAWIGGEIRRLLQVYPPEELAVLVRTSYVTEPIERAFFNMGIPYRVVGSVRFYERPEVRTLIDLLRLIHNPSDSVSFKRVVESFCPGVGERTVKKILSLSGGDLIDGSLRVATTLGTRGGPVEGLFSLLAGLRRESEDYPGILRTVLGKVGYQDLIRKRYPLDWEERWENVKELVRTVDRMKEAGKDLEDFLSEIALISSDDGEEGAVRIMTVHSAKGLEFSAVFLPRLEEGILPHREALDDPSELEEERRIFYVAVTRAKDLLYMSYTRAKGRKPSRFLSEIPKKLLNLEHFRRKVTYRIDLKPNPKVRVGVTVSHRVFGVGRVVRVEGERAEVEFRGEVRRIHTSFLEVLD